MRKILYLLSGLLVAIFMGFAYVKLSSGVPDAPGGADYPLMIFAVVFSWVTAFVPMPRWLAVVLGLAVVGCGLAVMCVTGIFVYLQYPNNTLADGAYAGFLCSIAMVASRAGSALKYMYREGGF